MEPNTRFDWQIIGFYVRIDFVFETDLESN